LSGQIKQKENNFGVDGCKTAFEQHWSIQKSGSERSGLRVLPLIKKLASKAGKP